MTTNRREVLKSFSILSAATLMPRPIYADAACVDPPKPKTGPCIVFKGLWAFWINDTSVTALTPHFNYHRIAASAWPSSTDEELNGNTHPGKRYSIDIIGKGAGSCAAELLNCVHESKLSIVLPSKQPYTSDQKKRTFSIRAGADFVSIQLPLPVSIMPLNYVRVNEQLFPFSGNDTDMLKGDDGIPIAGFPDVQAFVYSGDSATLRAVDGQGGTILAGSRLQNLHLRTIPTDSNDPSHEISAFDALVNIFQKQQASGTPSSGAQPLDLSLKSWSTVPRVITGVLPAAVQRAEVNLPTVTAQRPATAQSPVTAQGIPLVNCDTGAGLFGGR